MQTAFEEEFQQILADPKRFGAPTFEEFVKDPEKYLGKRDDFFVSAEDGAVLLKQSNLVKDQLYCLGNNKTDSLEEFSRWLQDEGIDVRNIEWCPELEKVEGGQYRILVGIKLKNKDVKNELNL